MTGSKHNPTSSDLQSSATKERENSIRLVADILTEAGKNVAMALPAVRRMRLRRPRAGAHFSGAPDQLERYAFQALRSLLDVVGSVKGLDIVEVGPGDSLTSGFSLLAAGAATYTVIDRFRGDYCAASSKEWYRGIERAWPQHFPDIDWPPYLDAGTFPEDYPNRVRVLAGSIEDEDDLAGLVFDVVCSYQVGEHVQDVPAFAEMSARMLRPDGTAVHRVDFGPHDCWLRRADPLSFLRFPDWLWRLMGSNRGYPNRERHPRFLTELREAGLKVDVRGLEVVDPAVVDFSRLSPRFRMLSANDICTTTAIYVCRHA